MSNLMIKRHKSLILSVIVIVFGVILVSTTVEGETLQQITFYTEENKMGQRQSFNMGEDINENSVAFSARSYCVEQGLWVLSIRNRISNSVTQEWIGGNVGGETCNEQPGSERNYLAIRPVGERDLEKSVLSLFPEVTWTWVNEQDNLVITGETHSANEDLTFRSYVLTGTENYQIFPEANFGGSSLCLVANANAGSKLTYGITSSYSTIINYRSSRRGCSLEDGDGSGNGTTTESSSVSQFSYPISKFSHFVNLFILYFSRKIIL